MNKKLRFAINWNMKLTNNVWSTIRLKNESKYQLHQNYDIVIEDNIHQDVYGECECIYIKHFTLDQISEPLFLLDMGLTKAYGIKMLKHLYADKNMDLDKAEFSFMLFKWKPQHQDVYQQTFAPGIKQVLQQTA